MAISFKTKTFLNLITLGAAAPIVDGIDMQQRIKAKDWSLNTGFKFIDNISLKKKDNNETNETNSLNATEEIGLNLKSDQDYTPYLIAAAVVAVVVVVVLIIKRKK